MKKAKFEYIKEDGSKSERTLLHPSFLKESYNSFKDFNKNEVKYLSGYEINKEGLDQDQLKLYENCINEYFSDIFMTLTEYVESKGLDPKKITPKTFKKEGIKNLDIIE